jgi:hypothetical protein
MNKKLEIEIRSLIAALIAGMKDDDTVNAVTYATHVEHLLSEIDRLRTIEAALRELDIHNLMESIAFAGDGAQTIKYLEQMATLERLQSALGEGSE